MRAVLGWPFKRNERERQCAREEATHELSSLRFPGSVLQVDGEIKIATELKPGGLGDANCVFKSWASRNLEWINEALEGKSKSKLTELVVPSDKSAPGLEGELVVALGIPEQTYFAVSVTVKKLSADQN